MDLGTDLTATTLVPVHELAVGPCDTCNQEVTITVSAREFHPNHGLGLEHPQVFVPLLHVLEKWVDRHVADHVFGVGVVEPALHRNRGETVKVTDCECEDVWRGGRTRLLAEPNLSWLHAGKSLLENGHGRILP